MTGVVNSVSICETQQAADDGDAERPAQLGARRRGRAPAAARRAAPPAWSSGSAGSAAGTAWWIAVFGVEPLVALGLEREVDHHDRVLLHDADEQDDRR